MEPQALALYGGLDAVLQCQQGVIRRDQALAAGLAESTIESFVSRRHWIRILPRTYSVGADLDNPVVRTRAGWLWAGADAIVAGAAAAWWLGLTDRPAGVVTLVIPPARRMSRQPGFAIIRARIHPSERRQHDHVAVTSPARTCLDLARAGEPDHLESALRQRKLTQEQLEESLALGRGVHGQRRARGARAAVADNPWSNPERAAHLLFKKARITGWTGNSPVQVHGGIRYPDLVYEDIKLLVEIDGREHHGSPQAFESDRKRQNLLVEAGWTVLRFTPAQLATDPGGVVATVKRTISRLRFAAAG
ncbi:MAG TPA: DUF559 domain-containing protein [Nakamurella sp.]